MRIKNIVERDVYDFECALAFVTIHPWANSKWEIDQLERALYFCYVISYASFSFLFFFFFLVVFFFLVQTVHISVRVVGQCMAHEKDLKLANRNTVPMGLWRNTKPQLPCSSQGSRKSLSAVCASTRSQVISREKQVEQNIFPQWIFVFVLFVCLFF